MGRQNRTAIEIVRGENFSFAFPAITNEAEGRIFEIVGYATGGSNVWKFRGDVTAWFASGVKFRVEQNGDPDACKEYTSSGAAHASGVTSVTVEASAIPSTATDYGFGRILASTATSLTTDTITCRIEEASGALQVAPAAAGNSTGVITISLTAVQTAALTNGRYRGDVKRVTTAPATSYPHAFDVLVRDPVT